MKMSTTFRIFYVIKCIGVLKMVLNLLNEFNIEIVTVILCKSWHYNCYI